MPSGNFGRGSIRVVFGGLLITAVMSARSVGSVMPLAPPADGGVAAKAVDLRPIFKNWGLAVHSQGGRGTCSAFVVTGALEYRLVYGELPDSLDKLVESGIMPARDLKDENSLPLRSPREGDFLVVESAQENGWTHRWQGLDPRR